MLRIFLIIIFILSINFYNFFANDYKKIILPNLLKPSDNGIIINYENNISIPRIVRYKDSIRKYFFDSNNKLKYFLHYSLQEILIYKVVFYPKNEFVIYHYNDFEWILKIEYYKNNGEKIITYIRPMKNAFSIHYNNKDIIISIFEY